MSVVGFDKDPTDMILSQIKQERKASHRSLSQAGHSYFQVEYMQQQIIKFNADEAAEYQKSIEEETTKEYLQQSNKDKEKEERLKYDLKTKYFRIKSQKPRYSEFNQLEKDPLQMIAKSYQMHQENLIKSCSGPSINDTKFSNSLQLSGSRTNLKNKFAEDVQQFLDNSLNLTDKKNKYKLRGGTSSDKQKINQKMMRDQRNEILQIIKHRDYSLHRPIKLDQIPNKEKYSIDYLEYLKLKTKMGLDKDLYQKKIRKIQGKLQTFQEFILREVKLKADTRSKLQNFYVKVRDEFKRIQRNQSPKRNK